MREFYSDSNLSNGKITIGIELPKNSFTFYEPIPFQLIISNQGYKTSIENITLSISKFVYLNNSNNRQTHFSTNSTKVLIKKVLNPSGDLRNYKFEDNIQIPEDLCPKKIYQEADNTKTLNFGCLTPFCIGGLISVEFFFKTEIKLKSGIIEFFEFPIELLSEDVNVVN